jgi:hypothetical protein
MKSIRKTTAKTRKGVLNWLAKLNPFMPSDTIYEDASIVAVHVNKYTGAIVYYETYAGHLLNPSLQFITKAA